MHYKVLYRSNGRLYSIVRNYPYPEHGPLPPTTPLHQMYGPPSGYHCLRNAADALRIGAQHYALVYAVTGFGLYHSHTWWYNDRPYDTDIFANLHVAGPFTGND